MRYRFTLLFLAAMVLANTAAGTLDGELPGEMLEVWGIGQEAVWSGDFVRLLTGTFLSHDVGMFFRQIVFAALTLGYTERVRGSLPAAMAFFALEIGSTLVLLTAVWMLPSLSDVSALNDVGMSMGGFGLVGLAIAGVRYRWFFLFAVLLAISIKVAVDFEPLTDTGHVIALLLGVLVGLLMQRKMTTGRPA
ncbi:hypothetical protein [Thiosulfatihalobacter marinus]|uniref:hypothetical protein n=1 Tax=Thiosulfatihalobacter marinus TaxID=2792481 RepID=UPI0018D5AC5C|nr:hypothetical protein [Thiosulfatihalobacter marinus]